MATTLPSPITKKLQRLAREMRQVFARINFSAKNWRVGDICIEVTKIASEIEDPSIISTFCKQAGLCSGTFRVYRWVAGIFTDPKVRDLPNLTWTHYREAANAADPVYWITLASKERLSISQLGSAMRGERVKITEENIPIFCSAGCGCHIVSPEIAVEHKDLGGKLRFCSWECLISTVRLLAPRRPASYAGGVAPSLPSIRVNRQKPVLAGRN